MKLSQLALSAAAAGTLAAAQPHRHHHRHADLHEAAKRAAAPAPQADGVDVVVVTVTVTGDGHGAPTAVASTAAVQQLKVATAPSSAAPAPAAPSSSAPAPPPAAPSSAPSSASSSSSGSGGKGVDVDFPDGTLDCSTFPSDYGAVKVDWMQFDGWSGIQDLGANYAKSQHCSENNACSYACPPGYLKSQWPSAQGPTGQSVGGLQCKGGKLHLTNPGLSKKLCIKGAGGVSVSNSVGKSIAVCRTDYPGTEEETIPASFDASAASYDLAIPDAASYYTWQGGKTSAQYYVNPAGTSVADGCQWSTQGSGRGNFAPINLGAGKSAGTKWLSITATEYGTTDLGFGIKITGGSTDCYYKHPNICQEGKCTPISNKGAGCTVSAAGEAKYEFF